MLTDAELLAVLLSLVADVVPVTVNAVTGIVPVAPQTMLLPAATLATGKDATGVLAGCSMHVPSVTPLTAQVALVAATLPTLAQVTVPPTVVPETADAGKPVKVTAISAVPGAVMETAAVAVLLAALLSPVADVVAVMLATPTVLDGTLTAQVMLLPTGTLATGNEATGVFAGCRVQPLAVPPATEQVTLGAATVPTLVQVTLPVTVEFCTADAGKPLRVTPISGGTAAAQETSTAQSLIRPLLPCMLSVTVSVQVPITEVASGASGVAGAMVPLSDGIKADWQTGAAPPSWKTAAMSSPAQDTAGGSGSWLSKVAVVLAGFLTAMLKSPIQLWLILTRTVAPVGVPPPQILAGTVKVELTPGSGPSGINAGQFVPLEPVQVVSMECAGCARVKATNAAPAAVSRIMRANEFFMAQFPT